MTILSHNFCSKNIKKQLTAFFKEKVEVRKNTVYSIRNAWMGRVKCFPIGIKFIKYDLSFPGENKILE